MSGDLAVVVGLGLVIGIPLVYLLFKWGVVGELILELIEALVEIILD